MQTQRTYISTNEITQVASQHTRLNDLLADVLAKRYQRKVIVKRVEIDSIENNTKSQDKDNQINGYRVWFE